MLVELKFDEFLWFCDSQILGKYSTGSPFSLFTRERKGTADSAALAVSLLQQREWQATAEVR